MPRVSRLHQRLLFSPLVPPRLAEILSQIPEQFSARLEVTSHMVDRTKEYPPWIREMDISYDHVAGRAKVVVQDGIDAGRTFLRLYESKKEYIIREKEYPSCRRSYLGERPAVPWAVWGLALSVFICLCR